MDPQQIPFVGTLNVSDLDELEAFETGDIVADEEHGDDEMAIHPVPLLFTDQFRWFL